MPAALPLVEDGGDIPSAWGLNLGGSAEGGGAAVSAGAGVNPSGNNTHLWVAATLLLALGGIVFLHISGFRFATDVGITKG